MKKWGFILLAIVIAIALGITVPMVWDYIVEFCQIAVAYLFDLCNSLALTLRESLQSAVAANPPAVTNPVV